ncbi:MAG: hypothetical protein HYU64_01230 [Armatimonadetes bacterium]|nr:hypothetical protein [Armatimonadota bacterium]
MVPIAGKGGLLGETGHDRGWLPGCVASSLIGSVVGAVAGYFGASYYGTHVLEIKGEMVPLIVSGIFLGFFLGAAFAAPLWLVISKLFLRSEEESDEL